MSSPIKQELQRLGSRFLVYGKTISIAMSVTAIFLTLFAGLQANYLTIQILTVLISTFSFALAGLFTYLAFKVHHVSTTNRSAELNEELIRQLIRDAQELTPPPKGHSVEGGLFRLTFLLSYRVAYAFYSTLQLLRFNLPGLKTEKKV